MKSRPTPDDTTKRRVRLVRKVANYLNGIDVSANNVGDVLDMHPLEAELLIAEGWAVPEFAERSARDRRSGRDRRQRSEPAQDAAAADAAPAPRVMPSVDQLRENRVDSEQRRSDDSERRRAHERIREELQDERATTITPPERDE